MTVIDVNSGKTKRKSRRGHLLSGKPGGCRRSSQTAAPAESVRYHHCGLHQYGGKERQKELLETLKNLTAGDPQHPRIVDMTPLGLVEITRKNLIPR